MDTTTSNNKRLKVAICLALAVVTAALYWPVLHHDFICLDDDAYIVSNPHVNTGLHWSGIVWAFRSGYAANWHPLTWILHQADYQLFGSKPAGHHATTLLFHVANTVLLFLWLNQLTGAVWRSAFVAALFAWHPLHVESVAWAAELKDTLSAFFWMLALMAYTRYARTRLTTDYALALLCFACGLMSKPMVVTLPFVLLLLDFWPLERFNRPAILRLLLEKLPFFALALGGSATTYLVQKSAGATWSSALLPFHDRLINALWAYERYISKLLWPVDLAVIYPYPRHEALTLAASAVVILALWSGLFLWRAKKNPYLIVGWLWFLGTLVPAIGLVQVGSQSMADRYMYLPSIGLFILAAWGLNDLILWRAQWRRLVVPATAAVLTACLVVTRHQLGYWQNSIRLLTHTLNVTTDNYVACNFLGCALDLAGRHDEALPYYVASVRIESHYPQAQFNLGLACLKQGSLAEACEHLGAAVRLAPAEAGAHFCYGTALLGNNRPAEAATQFADTLRLNPDWPEAQSKWGLALVRQGKTTDAIPHFAAVAQQQPDNADARFNLGLALLDTHQPSEAAAQFAAEVRLTPNEPKAHYRLAQALEQQNQTSGAIREYREALRLRPDFPEAQKALDALQAAQSKPR